MGTVVRFPDAGSGRVRYVLGDKREPATVIILPVIRIERYDDTPSDDAASGSTPASRRRRRRRNSQS